MDGPRLVFPLGGGLRRTPRGGTGAGGVGVVGLGELSAKSSCTQTGNMTILGPRFTKMGLAEELWAAAVGLGL